jgi:hypothetical protein
VDRRTLLSGALLALLPTACAAQARPAARPQPLQAPAGARLEPLGALLLDAEAIGVAGLSGLHLSPDLRLTAVSDLARWMTARLVLDAQGRPAGLAEIRTGPLRDGSGQPLSRGYTGDAESLARLPDGTWLVGFERWHRIRAFRTIDGPGGYVEVPRGLERAPGNGGLESLAALPDGRLLLLTEGLAPPGGRTALRRTWLGRPGSAWLPLAYRSAEAMSPVDATPLPAESGGGVLVLERSFSLLGGFGGRLVRIPAAALAAAGAETVLEGEELMRLEPPLPSDNYEGVAAARIGGRTVVVLASDDNENMLQRSWLLFFALAEEGA